MNSFQIEEVVGLGGIGLPSSTSVLGLKVATLPTFSLAPAVSVASADQKVAVLPVAQTVTTPPPVEDVPFVSPLIALLPAKKTVLQTVLQASQPSALQQADETMRKVDAAKKAMDDAAAKEAADAKQALALAAEAKAKADADAAALQIRVDELRAQEAEAKARADAEARERERLAPAATPAMNWTPLLIGAGALVAGYLLYRSTRKD